jgi:hypothetical protein
LIVSINQPGYLPWLGALQRIALSDLHVVLDHVQFEKNSVVNRNRIRTPDGWCWLTVPIRTKGRFGELPIRDVEIADGRWRSKHLSTLQMNYARAPWFESHLEHLDRFYATEWSSLGPLLDAQADYLRAAFDITTPIRHSSEMDLHLSKSELVLEICRAVGADEYLSGPFGRDYLDLDRFRVHGIEVRFHDFEHPSYRQAFPGFEGNMAAVDLLFNHGPDSRAILLAGVTA